MKKKTMTIVAVAIVLFMLIGVIAPIVSSKNNGNQAETGSSEEETVSSAQESSRIDGAADLLEAGEEEEAAGEEEEAETEAAEEEASEGGGSSGGFTGYRGSNTNSAKKAPSGEATKGKHYGDEDLPSISFPYAIPDSQLVIQQIGSYKGYFIEDGSDKAVSGIAAIVLTNKGSDLSFAGIGIAQGKRSLGFSATQIPAGATVIIQEQSGAAYSKKDPYYSATATTTPVENFDKSEELVTVKDNGDNTISVINISGEKLSEVSVLFKNYLPDEGVYVGGITYNIKLTDLEPDTQTDVTADHYDSSYSVIVEVSAKK